MKKNLDDIYRHAGEFHCAHCGHVLDSSRFALLGSKNVSDDALEYMTFCAYCAGLNVFTDKTMTNVRKATPAEVDNLREEDPELFFEMMKLASILAAGSMSIERQKRFKEN